MYSINVCTYVYALTGQELKTYERKGEKVTYT